LITAVSTAVLDGPAAVSSLTVDANDEENGADDAPISFAPGFFQGDSGADVFVVGPDTKTTVIVDFASDEDSIDLSAFGFSSPSAVTDLVTETPVGALVELDGDSHLLLLGTKLNDLNEHNVLV
jgi:hypothetical protein